MYGNVEINTVWWENLKLKEGTAGGTERINVKRSRIPTPTQGIPGAVFAIVDLLPEF